MIFKGEPNLFVRIANKFIQRVTGKKGFYFDNNGEFETENETLIKILSQKFEIKQDQSKEVVSIRHCKKCDFTCETQGQLLQHYKWHKREDK